MHRIVIADTSCLIVLEKIQQISIKSLMQELRQVGLRFSKEVEKEILKQAKE